MRFQLFILSFGLLLLPACNFRSTATSETEVAPIAAAPIPDRPPVVAEDQAIGQVESASVSPPTEAEFATDPAPVPPSESSASTAEQPSPQPSSAEDIFKSVSRVLLGAVEGAEDEAGERSPGSVFGSIGRALGKGIQEAAAERAANE